MSYTYRFEFPGLAPGAPAVAFSLAADATQTFAHVVAAVYAGASFAPRLPADPADVFLATAASHPDLPNHPLSRNRTLSSLALLLGTRTFALTPTLHLKARATGTDVDVTGYLELTGPQVRGLTLAALRGAVLNPFFAARNVVIGASAQVIVHVDGDTASQGLTVGDAEPLAAYVESIVFRTYAPQLTLVVAATSSGFLDSLGVSYSQLLVGGGAAVPVLTAVFASLRGQGTNSSVVGQFMLLADAVARVFVSTPLLDAGHTAALQQAHPGLAVTDACTQAMNAVTQFCAFPVSS